MFTRPIYCYSLLIFLFALFPFSAGRSYLGWEYRFLEAGACPSLGLGFPFFFFFSFLFACTLAFYTFVCSLSRICFVYITTMSGV